MATVKIATVTPFNKKGICKLEGGIEVSYWLDSAFTPLLVAGAEVEMKTEEKPAHNNPDKMERWIVSVNGQAAKAQRTGGGGGGGGFKGQPKDDEAIVAQVILKEACETARTNASSRGEVLAMTEVGVIAEGLTSIYQKVYRNLKDGAK